MPHCLDITRHALLTVVSPPVGVLVSVRSLSEFGLWRNVRFVRPSSGVGRRPRPGLACRALCAAACGGDGPRVSDGPSRPLGGRLMASRPSPARGIAADASRRSTGFPGPFPAIRPVGRLGAPWSRSCAPSATHILGIVLLTEMSLTSLHNSRLSAGMAARLCPGSLGRS